MKIGQFELSLPLALAPMAGITDKPFRHICSQEGARWVVGEMISGDPALRHTTKTKQRIDHAGETGPIVMQIAGSDPEQLAMSAHHHVTEGADVIDINMGCPAKKVCHRFAGSALMKDEALVHDILKEVVSAVSVPVTLKTRLGWDDEHLNVLSIAQIAEEAGIAALAIHGRSRTQMYRGEASYDLIKEVKHRVALPIWVNGDITTAKKAAQVLDETNADGVMIGRGAQGHPWLFREVAYFLKTGSFMESLSLEEKIPLILGHIKAIYAFYGEKQGVRISRKHIISYLFDFNGGRAASRAINTLDDSSLQYEALSEFLFSQV